MGIGIKIKVKGSLPKVDNIKVTLKCPSCDADNRVALAQIKREETIQCGNCSTKIKLVEKDKSVKRGTDKVQSSFDELKKVLKGLER